MRRMIFLQSEPRFCPHLNPNPTPTLEMADQETSNNGKLHFAV